MSDLTTATVIDNFLQATTAAAARAVIGSITNFPAIALYRTVYVNKSGNDSTGTGILDKPYVTVAAALAAIIAAADNTESTPYIVKVGPGVYTDAIAVMPWVWIVGDGVLGGPTGNPALFHTLSVGGSTWLNGAITWHASWGDANNQRGGLANLYVGLDNAMGNAPVGSNGMIFDCFNVGAHNFSMAMRGVTSCWNYFGGFINDPHIINGYSTFQNVHITISLSVTGDDFSGTTVMDLINCKVKELDVNSTGGGTTVVNAVNCDITTATIDGATASIKFDATSYPKSAAPTLTNSGSFTLTSKAPGFSYVPTTPGDWNGTAPNNVQTALDRLAAAMPTPP